MKNEVERDNDGFPKPDEFFIPVLKVLSKGDYTEEDISNKLVKYFDLYDD